jgi:hypothetical protein
MQAAIRRGVEGCVGVGVVFVAELGVYTTADARVGELGRGFKGGPVDPGGRGGRRMKE